MVVVKAGAWPWLMPHLISREQQYPIRPSQGGQCPDWRLQLTCHVYILKCIPRYYSSLSRFIAPLNGKLLIILLYTHPLCAVSLCLSVSSFTFLYWADFFYLTWLVTKPEPTDHHQLHLWPMAWNGLTSVRSSTTLNGAILLGRDQKCEKKKCDEHLTHLKWGKNLLIMYVFYANIWYTLLTNEAILTSKLFRSVFMTGAVKSYQVISERSVTMQSHHK